MVQDKEARSKETKKMWTYLGVVLLVFVLCVPVLSREIKERKGMGTTINTKSSAESESGSSAESESESESGIKPDVRPDTELDAELGTEPDKGSSLTEPNTESSKQLETESESMLENVWIEEIIWPLEGEVIRETGLSYAKTFSDYRYHNGIDIKAERGTEVVMTLPGRIIKKETTKDEGLVLTVEHGQENGQIWRSVYAHLSEATVKKGDYCKAGEIIGVINQPGYNEIMEGPHLHYSLFKDGQMVNPLDYLP